MINRKILTIVITTIMLTILVGCSNSSAYSEDYNNMREINTVSLEISDTYSKSDSKSQFKKESKKIMKDLEKTKMRTKEGKDLLKAYVEISKYLIDTILDNWNKGILQGMEDKKLIQLEANLEDKMNKFEEKIEELKVESGFYEMLEELK